ncbi:MAG: hypothetical protein E3J88_06400 [Anaerolineales bacterium]|nr:MAG: hypothetical protein E3J88_06400 [Anaerolineales bacterium]
MSSHNQHYDFDASLKRSLKYWANKQTPPQSTRYHLIRTAAQHNQAREQIRQLYILFRVQLEQLKTTEQKIINFSRWTTHCIESDMAHLRVVS